MSDDGKSEELGSTTYPRRAADHIRELFDELTRACDDFVGGLLQKVSAKECWTDGLLDSIERQQLN